MVVWGTEPGPWESQACESLCLKSVFNGSAEPRSQPRRSEDNSRTTNVIHNIISPLLFLYVINGASLFWINFVRQKDRHRDRKRRRGKQQSSRAASIRARAGPGTGCARGEAAHCPVSSSAGQHCGIRSKDFTSGLRTGTAHAAART